MATTPVVTSPEFGVRTGHKASLTVRELRDEFKAGNVFLKESKSKGNDTDKRPATNYYWSRKVQPPGSRGVRFTIGNPTWPEEVQPFLLTKPTPFERNGQVQNPDSPGALIGVPNVEEATDLMEIHECMKTEVARVIGKGPKGKAPGNVYKGLVNIREDDDDADPSAAPRVLAISTKLWLKHKNEEMRTMMNLISVDDVPQDDGTVKKVVKYDKNRTFNFDELAKGMRVTATVDIGKVDFYQGRWTNSLYTRYLFRNASRNPASAAAPFSFGDVDVENEDATAGGYSSPDECVKDADKTMRAAVGKREREDDDTTEAHDTKTYRSDNDEGN